MRSLLKDDIQDAFLQFEARVLTNMAGNGLQTALRAQWAAPRPPTLMKSSSNGSTDEGDSKERLRNSGNALHGHARARTRAKTEIVYIEQDDLGESSSDSLTGCRAELTGSRTQSLTSDGGGELKAFNSMPTFNTMKNEMKVSKMRRSIRKRKALNKQMTGHLLEAYLGHTRLMHAIEMFLENGIGVIIVLNGIFIGAQADYQARELSEAVPAIFPLVEIVFCVIFFVELIMRLLMFGRKYFIGPGWRWNWFDLTLVIIQLVEVIGMLTTNHESSSASPVANVSFLRLLRILRLFRVLRLVRLVQFIGELNTIISSIANSMKSLCWTLFLLLLMIYIVAILFTQVVFSERVLMDQDAPNARVLSHWWGTLDRSILTLYQAILGGVDWEDVTTPLTDAVSPLCTLLFALYIAFSLLAMMNVITGIFVESALKNAEKEKDAEFTETAHALFVLSDLDQSGHISWDEFEMQIDEPRFRQYMQNFGIDPADAKLLFKLLDHDKSSSLELEELVDGLVRLRAGAKFMDIMKIMHEIERTNRKLTRAIALSQRDPVKKFHQTLA